MFNFTISNKGLFELSGDEFKVLYFLLNNSNLNKSNITDNIHNIKLMEVCKNCCERKIQLITKKLEELGYIKKIVVGSSTNNKGNKYQIIGMGDTTVADNDIPEIKGESTFANNDTTDTMGESTDETGFTLKKKDKNIYKEKYNIINKNTIEKESSESVNYYNASNEETYSNDNVNLDNDNSSKEESYNVPTIEFRAINDSNNNLLEENNNKNDINNNSMENECFGENSNLPSTFELVPPQKTPPHAPHDNRKEVDDNALTDYFNDVLENAKRRYDQTKNYDYGFECFENACKYIDKNYKNLNEEIIIQIMEQYNTYINENKAVSDTLKGSDNKSITEDIETRQEANKGANLTINGTPIEEIYKMVTSQAIRKGAKFGYEEGMNEINRLFKGLEERYNYFDNNQKDIMIKNFHREICKIYPDKKVV